MFGEEKKFLFQRAIQWLSYFLAGIIALGAVLDAASNAISIITPWLTYVITPVIFILLVCQKPILNKYPISWKLRSGQVIPIKRLGIQPNLILIGILLLLWLPRLVTQSDSIKQVTTTTDNSYRPEEILPQAFYLHSSLFSFINNYPFDLYLGLKLDKFKIRYSGIVKELKCPLKNMKLYGLKQGQIEYNAKGRIDEENTFFLFQNNELVVVILSFVFDPTEELLISGKLDRQHPLGFGRKYDQGAIYLWISEMTVYSETLAWCHGYSSGLNSFRLFKNDFVLNDMLIKMDSFYADSDNLGNHYSEFLSVLDSIHNVLTSDEYNNYLFVKFGLSPAVLPYANHRYKTLIDHLKVLERVWNK